MMLKATEESCAIFASTPHLDLPGVGGKSSRPTLQCDGKKIKPPAKIPQRLKRPISAGAIVKKVPQASHRRHGKVVDGLARAAVRAATFAGGKSPK